MRFFHWRVPKKYSPKLLKNVAKTIFLHLLLPEYLLEILEHDPLYGVYNHPQRGQGLPDQLLALLLGVPDIEHDVANDVVVEGEGGLLRQLRDEADQGAQDLEGHRGVVTGQLLHEVLQEQVAILHKAEPDHLREEIEEIYLHFES